MFDLGSYVRFLFSSWRWGDRDGEWGEVLIWLSIPLGVLLGWRLYSKHSIRRTQSKKSRSPPVTDGPGSDSAFYRIVKHLARSGLPCRPGETLNQWIHRITDGDDAAMDKDALRTALDFHYRHRFDPQGLTPEQRERLHSTVSEWMASRSSAASPI